jgi:hypothetical protein
MTAKGEGSEWPLLAGCVNSTQCPQVDGGKWLDGSTAAFGPLSPKAAHGQKQSITACYVDVRWPVLSRLQRRGSAARACERPLKPLVSHQEFGTCYTQIGTHQG